MRSYKELHVWQKSIELVECIYDVTRTLPDEERFGLVSQMRRSALSIPSNIAEGHGRKTDGDFSYFLRVAFGSSSELETQLVIAKRLKMLSDKDYDNLTQRLVEVRKMLNKLITAVQAKS